MSKVHHHHSKTAIEISRVPHTNLDDSPMGKKRSRSNQKSFSSFIPLFHSGSDEQTFDEKPGLMDNESSSPLHPPNSFRKSLFRSATKMMNLTPAKPEEKNAVLEELYIDPKCLLPKGVKTIAELKALYREKREDKKKPEYTVFNKFTHKGRE